MTIEQLDLSVFPMFSAMTARGMLVDRDKLRALQVEVRAQAEEQLALVEQFTGVVGLNPMSGDQVAAWLGTEIGTGGKKTRGRKRLATDERALSMVEHPAIDAILDYRGLKKLDGTFIEGTLRASTKDGRVHPRWRLTKVRSGRAAVGSSEDDDATAFSDDALNMMAIPSRDELGKRLRDCFIADPGHVMFSIDYSQFEPRLAAALSGDPELLAIYRQGRDIYTEVAVGLFRTRVEAVDTFLHRLPAKIVTLGVFYGMGAEKLYEELIRWGCGTPSKPMFNLEQCREMIERWFRLYPRVKDLARAVCSEARALDGWAYTQGGRGRLLPALFLSGMGYPEEKMRLEAERQAFNHRIQGTAQEYMKKGMLAAWESGVPFEPLLQIHDELIGQTREESRVTVLAYQMQHTVHCADGGEIVLQTKAKTAPAWGGLKG